MGRRKKHAPKRGSLAYLPKGRAASWVGRVRYWPRVEGEPRLLAFPGYKAGMTHIVTVDQHKSSLTFGREVSLPITVLETPPLIICGLRLYGMHEGGLRTLGEAWSTETPKDLGRLITPAKNPKGQEALERIGGLIGEASEVRVIAATQPRLTSVGRKKPHLIEIKVGGGTLKEQFEYAKGLLGREVKPTEVFKEGSYVDVVAVTKGKGIQGPVKRWGVRILHHKSRKTRRGVGSIGGWTPSSIIYSVPRAGQTGFFQRTEYNKQIVKAGEDGSEVTPKGGFPHYGILKGGYVMLSGSVPGAVKRLVMIRYPARAAATIEEPPKIEYLSLESKQGD
ncbi:MAG: 50S ribosomal protein L3 [Candidatus Bathyarchaeia archaeon]